MNRNKGKYFTVSDLKKIENGCDYLFLLGERANGKSYAVKQRLLQLAYDNTVGNNCNMQFAYIRRFDLDCKDSVCEPYFADMPISTITNGEYTTISVYRKKVYFANIDADTMKVIRGVCIGQCFALSSAEHYKSLMFPNIYSIIFEEVISQDNQYLFSEPNKLQQLISTILRDRTGRVYLIGNTISRMCPYYREWGFINVENLPQGREVTYTHGHTKIKVYRCKSRNYNSGMFFGNSAKNITEGEYYTEEYPHIASNKKNYDNIYNVVLKHENFLYLLTLLRDSTGNYFWYVEPKTTTIQDGTRVISHEYNSSPLWTNGFLPYTEKEHKAFNILLIQNKVVFSDNLTGTEFNNILKNYR